MIKENRVSSACRSLAEYLERDNPDLNLAEAQLHLIISRFDQLKEREELDLV